MPATKRTAEDAGFEDGPPAKIPRVQNGYFLGQSSTRYVLTGNPPKKKANQVGDIVEFVDKRPGVRKQLERALEAMPKDAGKGGHKNWNTQFSLTWHSWSDEEKRPFNDYFEELKKEQAKRFPNYKYQPQSPKSKGKASTPSSPQSTTSSPESAASSSSFSPDMPFTPGTGLSTLGGSPEAFSGAVLNQGSADTSCFKQQYDSSSAHIQPETWVQESLSIQGSPYAYGMGAYQVELPMLASYSGYTTQPLQAYDANMAWGTQYAAYAPLPPLDYGENGLAVLGGGDNHWPQGNNALLGVIEPQYGSQHGSPQTFGADLSFPGLCLGGSPTSTIGGSPLEAFGDFDDILNFGSWQASGSPVSHASALYPGF
ncbi:hypothetical protein PENSPDRAFT_734633 [Peniophora sp. CONT]|nr:hypothetical protein PENSPDRAFT_734633 [Peniophora sp. CONT]